jgi:hypothetical protein
LGDLALIKPVELSESLYPLHNDSVYLNFFPGKGGESVTEVF